jgi:ATP-dependent DNA ligase
MARRISTSIKPMEASPVDSLPTGQDWLFEPKWDGFRCLAFRDGPQVKLQSRNQKPLDRYFPELVTALKAVPSSRFVFDGEIIIRGEPFDTLQLRLHPAESRVRQLARQFPATYVAFDLLKNRNGRVLLGEPFEHRREELDSFFRKIPKTSGLIKSRATRSRTQALKWLRDAGHGLDGIVAKQLDLPYRPGERAMQKYKLWKTVDCIVGGYYPVRGGSHVEYLLLGLYDRQGRLNYLGRAGVDDKSGQIQELLSPLVGGKGFTGRAPGGKSRWSDRQRKVVPLRPKLVVEAIADHIENKHFRHGARLIRWRDDKRPAQCTMDQIR